MEFLTPPTTPKKTSLKSSRRSVLPTSSNSPIGSVKNTRVYKSYDGEAFSSMFPSFDAPSDAGMITPVKSNINDNNSNSIFNTPNNGAPISNNSSIIIPDSPMTSSSLSCDRFIPNRSSVDFDYCTFVLQDENNSNCYH